MRWLGLGCAIIPGFILQGLPAQAETSLDVLEQDLTQVRQEHSEASAQIIAAFFNSLQTAAGSPDAALDLYQNAGGKMPWSTPVQSLYENETPDEKKIRLAKDNARTSNLAEVAQVHCGLMRFAARFVLKPDTKGLQDDWVAWLKNAAQRYPDLKTMANAPDADAPAAAPPPANEQNKSSHRNQPRIPEEGPHVAQALMRSSMKDSIIGKYLGFHGWGDAQQGQWKIEDLTKLYRSAVLDPLRTAHNTELLTAWDVYIAMRQVDEADPDKWVHIEYPSLAFEKGCDDFALSPSTEKLEILVNLLKANPDHPQIEDMTTRTHQMLQDYRARKNGGAPPAVAPAAATTTTSSNGATVTVTTTTSGDATIVTTTTNAPPAAPKP